MARIAKARKKGDLSEHQLQEKRDKERLKKQRYRQKMSDQKKKAIYQQQHQYKQGVWLAKAENQVRQLQYSSRSRRRKAQKQLGDESGY